MKYKKHNKNTGWPRGNRLLAKLTKLGKSIADEQREVAEARINQLQHLAEDHLAEIEDGDAVSGQLLRAEAKRLFGRCYKITESLSRGNLQAAYDLSCSNDGEMLGVAG